MSEFFDLRNIEYNLRAQTDFSVGAVCTTNYDLRSLRYLAQKICNVVPADTRNVSNVSDIALKIKSWKPDACSCNLCCADICPVGFIN